MINVMVVGLGGAIGAMARYVISLIPIKTVFPYLTLMTNLLGALLIGFIVGFATLRGTQEKWVLFWKIGICGGFTTFSTFSLEAYQLYEKGNTGVSILYMILSVVLCLVGVILGQQLAYHLFKK